MTNKITFSAYFSLVLVLFASWSGTVICEDDKIDFSRQVLPILSNKCFVCHGPDSEKESELRLDTFSAATQDLGGYKAIDVEHPEKSQLLQRIHDKDDPMPPEDAEKQLNEEERKILSAWVKQGGKYFKHWAYVAPKKTSPKSSSATVGSDVIDGFVRDQLALRSLKLAKPADKETLARRTALTLTGLPPEQNILQTFLKDSSEKAFENFVDKLLTDKKFGEHQARYWLDAVRYGDTHGLHLDNKRGIYPYRDWVVRAFNNNLHFDDFITWQLAGDLLPDPSLEQRVATGFVRMNPSTSEGGAIPAEFQAKNNFDRTENLGTVFLGMSLVCARCHTHKYDPIPQTEYYRLMAFFNSTAESPMDGNKYEYGPVMRAPKNQIEWDKWNELEKEQDSIISAAKSLLSRIRLRDPKELNAFEKADRTGKLELIAKPLNFFEGHEFVEQAQQLLPKMAAIKKGFTTTLVAKELPKARETKLLHRGEYNQPEGESLKPGIISVAASFPPDAESNRLGLAKWLTSADNPLTSRVLINRVWAQVFGVPLVRTPEDFGLQGEQPTHPELLDWLAVEFRESEWDFKHMLKLMVLSKTFQQSSAWRSDVDDPENRLFGRGPRYRLDAEVLRDIALWGSGMMVNELGGEGIKPYQPAGMWLALAHPGSNTKNYVPDKGEKLYRRSLYVYWKRTSPHPMMTLFDAPSRESSCVQRSRSNTSLQSLGLFNETQRIEFSRKFAERLIREQTSDGQRLDQLFTMVACRKPTENEKSVCETLLSQMKKKFAASEKEAVELLSIGDAKRDEKLNPADVAAWTQVVVTLLASDIAILMN